MLLHSVVFFAQTVKVTLKGNALVARKTIKQAGAKSAHAAWKRKLPPVQNVRNLFSQTIVRNTTMFLLVLLDLLPKQIEASVLKLSEKKVLTNLPFTCQEMEK